MNVYDAPICMDCRFLDRTREQWPHACLHVEVATERDLVTGYVLPVEHRLVIEGVKPSCAWARDWHGGPCGRAGKLFEPLEKGDG